MLETVQIFKDPERNMNLKPNITCAMVLWGGGDISSDRRNVKKTVTLQWVHITVFYEDIS